MLASARGAFHITSLINPRNKKEEGGRRITVRVSIELEPVWNRLKKGEREKKKKSRDGYVSLDPNHSFVRSYRPIERKLGEEEMLYLRDDGVE